MGIDDIIKKIERRPLRKRRGLLRRRGRRRIKSGRIS